MKKTDNKPKAGKKISVGKAVAALKSETALFVIGLLCVIFGVYMILAFISFFFTGGNDQSILAHPRGGELLETGNGIQNYAGTRGAQLAQFLINGCFGLPAFLIVVFLVVAGMKLMKAYSFNLTRWFLACATAMIWASVTLGFAFGTAFSDSFIYPGGLHGYRISLWLQSQIGAPGLALLLLAVAVLFGVAVSRKTIFAVRKAFRLAEKAAADRTRTVSTRKTGGRAGTDGGRAGTGRRSGTRRRTGQQPHHRPARRPGRRRERQRRKPF